MSDDKERPDIRYEHPLLDFPAGNGDPDCLKCKGRGVVPIMVDAGDGVMWPGGATQNCDCMFKRDLLANVKRVWPVLLNVESSDGSPLLNLTKQSLWITASNYDFRQHLRFVAFRMGTAWDAKVIGDSTLMTAWLATKKTVYDGDVNAERSGYSNDEMPSQEYLTMVDLAVPFDLLIVRLGVKAAANKEMANLLAEAINERDLQGKPTWVADSLLRPLGPGHLCCNEAVMELLDGFRRVVLSEDQPAHGAAGQYPARREAPGEPTTSPTIPGSAYTRRKGGMAPAAPAAPQEPSPDGFVPMPMEDDGERPSEGVPEPEDEDEFSVDALLADAHDPQLAEAGEGRLPDGGVDIEELTASYPEPDELGGNASELPAFLRGPLTKEERVQQEQREKREKRRKKNEGGDR